MHLKTRNRRHRRKGGAHTSRLSHSSESKEAAEAETKGKAAAVNAQLAARLANTQAAWARSAALKARDMARAVDEASDDSDDEDRGSDQPQPQYQRMLEYKTGVYKGNVKSRFGYTRHGFGEFAKSGSTYQGEWNADKQEGFGVYIVRPNMRRQIEGYTYEGEWKGGVMTGYGVTAYSRGDSYSGHQINDAFDGYGVYLHVAAGGVSQCEYKNGVRDGFGTYEDAYRTYCGMFVNDKFIRGRGTIRGVTGDYTGDLKGKPNSTTVKHGNGTYTYTNGDVYEGQFKNDKRYGKGKLTLTNGTVQEGIWSGDKLTGEITYPPGAAGPASVHGEFINGVSLTPVQETIFSGDDTDPDT
jgi:hypothetical protein